MYNLFLNKREFLKQENSVFFWKKVNDFLRKDF